MRVLIACEESQRVCNAFRALGHEAYSCDIQECSGGHPEWHIHDDCLPLLNGFCAFETQAGEKRYIDGKWDLIIAHPPCTRLCSSGQRWLYYGSEEYMLKKVYERSEAIRFFLAFTKADCPRIVIENPVGIMSTFYRKPNQIYNPYNFEGETEGKRTCLWFIGEVPLLNFTRIVPLPKNARTRNIWKACFDGKQYSWNSDEVSILRSKTPVGVAKAMAEQWGSIDKNKEVKHENRTEHSKG